MAVPNGLRIIVRVNVDETGRDKLASRVNFLGGGAFDLADGDDHAVLNGNVGGEWGSTGTIDNGAVAHDQIIMSRHGIPP